METTYFGAQALVYLKYEGEISKLAKILCAEFQLPEIYFDTNEEPPHEVFGMCETLGFELWLNKSTLHKGFNFEIQIETSMDVRDRFETELFDLSSWFAKEISRRCEIETYF
jgi:hypothetical protein